MKKNRRTADGAEPRAGEYTRLVGFLFALALVLAPAVAAPGEAAAQGRPAGLYGGLFVNYVWSGEPRVEDSRNPGGADGTLTLEPDYGYGGYVGYAFANGLRVEFEATMREVDNDELRVGGFGSAAPVRALDGDITHYTGMINAYWDPVRVWRLEPYIGAGIGISFAGIDSNVIGLDDDTTAFAYQAMAGVRARVLDRLYFVTGYKYFATSNLRLGGATLDYHAHTIDFGLAWHF